MCGLEGEDGGNTGGEDYGHGSLFCPCGTKAKDEKACDGTEANEIKEGSGFFGHILVHFCGDIAALVEGGLDLAHFKTSVGGVSCLHDDRSHEVSQESQGEADRENGFLIQEKACQKNRRDEEGEDDRKVVEHDVEMFSGKKARAHGFTMERERALSN